MKKYKNKLRYRSWHRGTKEADLFLGKFFENNISKMTYNEMLLYEDFLNLVQDNDILSIVQGKKKWPVEAPKVIIKLIEDYIRSENIR